MTNERTGENPDAQGAAIRSVERTEDTFILNLRFVAVGLAALSMTYRFLAFYFPGKCKKEPCNLATFGELSKGL